MANQVYGIITDQIIEKLEGGVIPWRIPWYAGKALGNFISRKPCGKESYSRKEQIAEIGAAFLCEETGIQNRTLENSAAYIQGWLKVLKEDRKILLKAGKIYSRFSHSATPQAPPSPRAAISRVASLPSRPFDSYSRKTG